MSRHDSRMIENIPCPEPTYVFRSRVIRWVDGDTVDLVVSLPFHLALGNPDKPARFRLLAINAYEMNTAEGKQAKDFVIAACPVGSKITIRSHQVDEVDSFGRWLIEVWAPDGTYIAKALIDAGLAVPYRK